MRINPPNILSQAMDFSKRMINPVINEYNYHATKLGQVTPVQRFRTVADKEAEDYQKAVAVRQGIVSGTIRENPNSPKNNYVYKGLTGDLTEKTPQPFAKISSGISNFISNLIKPPVKPQKNNQLVPTHIPTRAPTATPTRMPIPTKTLKYPLPTITPYPSPTPIPGLGSGSMNEDTNKFIEKVILPMAKRYNVNPGIMTGQFANEGRLGGIGANKNNFYNIGVTDTMVAEARKTGDWSKIPGYASPELGVERYLQFISGTGPDALYANGVDGAPTGKMGKKQFAEAWAKYRHDAPMFLKTIGSTYASSGDAYAANTMNTPEYKKYVIPKKMMAQIKKDLALIKKHRLTQTR